MQFDWILEVLTDLRGFARANGLPELADQLEATTQIAASEISISHGRGPQFAGLDAVGPDHSHSVRLSKGL